MIKFLLGPHFCPSKMEGKGGKAELTVGCFFNIKWVNLLKITYFQVIYFSKSSRKSLRKINTFNFYLTISIITRLATNYYYITIRINEVIKFPPSPHFCVCPKWKERSEGWIDGGLIFKIKWVNLLKYPLLF